MEDEITKTYVERKYNGVFTSNSVIEEIDDREPLKIKNDGKILGFRFFNRNIGILDGKQFYISEAYNYSNWIIFGKRMSVDEIINKYKNSNNMKYKMLVRKLEKDSNCKYYCYVPLIDYYVKMDEGDMTFEEVVCDRISENDVQIKKYVKK